VIGTRWVTLAISLILLGLLSACSTLPTQPTVDPADRKARLEALNEFSFSGGLGIWTDEQSISARVQWQQSDDGLAVGLTGPFGIGDMLLEETAGIATLSRSGTVVTRGSNVDTVLQTGLGLAVPVPVGQLKSWVIGLPGDAESVVFDTQGKLSSLRFTDGQGRRWQARFLRYTELDGLDVPAIITASGGEYSVRLLLKNWNPAVHSEQPENERPNTRLAIPSR